MFALELKEQIHQIVAQLNDESALGEIRQFLNQFVRKTDDPFDGLTPAQYARLERSILESEDETNLVSHEEVKKMAAQWLS